MVVGSDDGAGVEEGVAEGGVVAVEPGCGGVGVLTGGVGAAEGWKTCVPTAGDSMRRVNFW